MTSCTVDDGSDLLPEDSTTSPAVNNTTSTADTSATSTTDTTSTATTSTTAAFAPSSDVSYKLQTLWLEDSNKCFEGNKFDSTSTLEGAAFMDDCADVSGQLWKFVEYDSVNRPGYYYMKTVFLENENQCLEGNGISPTSTLGGASFMTGSKHCSCKKF